MNNDQPDLPVQDTNAQALQAKLSAVQKGYFQDHFAGDFVLPGPKRDIIMHRGYWARQNIFKVLVERYLSIDPETEKQIISLGCGYDTLFFNLNLEEKYNAKHNKYVFYEVDLEEVVKKKIAKINNSPNMKKYYPELIDKNDKQTNTLMGDRYRIFPCDLTHLDDFKAKLEKYGVDFSKPTFVFAECVLTYIESQYTNNILQFLQQSFDQVMLMDYEMCNPQTPFGKQMVKNFQLKGCPLKGIHDYPTIESQIERLKKMNYNEIEIYDMLTIYNQCCDQNERHLIEKLELLDEFEEWNIFQQHYFISLAFAHKFENEVTKKYKENCKLKMN
ncbi:hypothetical protein PPERSA_11231 [Pseudocohnilembus persalinus]|uniref:Leucine carboxyl methyltransferase 1 n=1 Tax=Pseudocohnilembus persalinus TaxID=266149 RepID=A0A0V0QZI0_PSEPJ|nr:hypothetical protein PPERSA_11231 [Pseudocohnilembus persalinus]|eukprot:KRX07682.1 hypothetical protein PPERSA_11231 [Pseudocohnilembus persalinus]